MKLHFTLLMVIMVLGAGFRWWQLDTLPAALNRDEAALAYNAFLLQQTGVDEWSRRWPLALESFGDFKLAGYPWLVIGAFHLFGWADWVVRLPSALAGVLLIPLAYLFNKRFFNSNLSLMAAGLIAITPIFIFYSRMAWEANVALALMVAILVILLKQKWSSSHQRWWLDVVAVGLAAWAICTYNTPLLLLPFIVVILPLVRGVKKWQAWLLPVVGLSLVWVVLAMQLLPLTAQKKGITLFGDETLTIDYGKYRDQFSGVNRQLLGNQYVYFGRYIVQNTVKSFSPDFLVWKGGGHPWHQVVGFGHLYLTVYILGLVGLAATITTLLNSLWSWLSRKQVTFSNDWLLLYLLLVSLLASAITVDAPHATRSLLFFFIFISLSVKGWAALLALIQRIVTIKVALIVISLLLAAETVQYLRLYFVDYPQHQGVYQPGFDKMIAGVHAVSPDQPVAIVDGAGYVYILLAWYTKLPPDVFLSTVVRQLPDQIGFRYGEQVERYHFVAKAADRRPAEQIIVEWNTKTETWEVRGL